jgi:BON domain-containing protein
MTLKRQPKQSKVKQAAQRTQGAATDHPRFTGALVAALVVLVAAFAFLRNKGRRKSVAGAASGAVAGATAPVRQAARDYDDVTLARMVESEILGRPGAPKGAVSVNVQFGVVELRGQVESADDVDALGKAAGKVNGVKDVHNLLHTPGTPAEHAPVSTPDEVRDRADEISPQSRFSRGQEPSAS